MILLVHIVAGGIGIVSGFSALFAAKGGRLHRRSGRVFVYAMVTMASTGALIAALGGGEASVVAGLLAGYLVVTALTTVRPPAPPSPNARTAPLASMTRWLAPGLMVLALAIGLASVAMGIEAVANGGKREGIPAVVLFKFALVGLLAAAGDLRVIRSGALEGARRLSRHLWRMGFALYIASASFFLGQADEFPEAIRIPALLAIPAFLPLLVMFFWLWRVRFRPTARPLSRVEPAAPAPSRLSA